MCRVSCGNTKGWSTQWQWATAHLGQTSSENTIYCIIVFVVICSRWRNLKRVVQEQSTKRRQHQMALLQCESLRQICKKLWNLKRDQCMFRVSMCVSVCCESVTYERARKCGDWAANKPLTIHMNPLSVAFRNWSCSWSRFPFPFPSRTCRQRIISLIGLRC